MRRNAIHLTIADLPANQNLTDDDGSEQPISLPVDAKTKSSGLNMKSLNILSNRSSEVDVEKAVNAIKKLGASNKKKGKGKKVSKVSTHGVMR